jgi:ribosomal protein L37AE/L43A
MRTPYVCPYCGARELIRLAVCRVCKKPWGDLLVSAYLTHCRKDA